MRPFRRLRRAVRVHGVAGTAKVGARSVMTWPARRRWMAKERDWDARHGVNTAGIVPLTALAIDSSHRDFGVRYQASSPDGFRALIRSLPVPPEQLTFIDLGAGKGRALLMASEFPFRRVIGVEFAPALADVARANVQSFQSDARACADVAVLCADAVDYDLPDEPSVVYIYNAFERPVMQKVLANVARSRERNPRPLLLALADCSVDPTLLQETGMRRVAADEHGEIFAA